MDRDLKLGRFDTVSIAGTAVFSALALILGAASQALGLNFPIIPYLQFDLGEVAIVLAFFIFGPAPAAASSFVEFLGLMVFGQQIPVGPLLKLFALLSSVAGLWLGSKTASRWSRAGLGGMVSMGGSVGALTRAAVMTLPNFYLIVFLYSIAGIEGFLKAPFAAIGIVLTDANALALVLGFTALFNVLQLDFVVAVSYLVLRVPSVSNVKAGGKAPWFTMVLRANSAESPDSLR